MMERQVWHNGNFIPESEAKVSIYDSALMWGDMAFEMMRTFNKEPFKLQEHLNRLDVSCRILEMSFEALSFSQWGLRKGHKELLKWHIEQFPEEEEWRTLINVSRGTLPMYQEMLGESGTNVMIACFPLRYVLKGHSQFYRKGIHAIVPSQRAIPQHLLDPKLKTRSRQHLQIANLEVKRQDPEAWALLLDEQGYIAEFTGANVFVVKNGYLYTPPAINCLAGISRKHVMGGHFVGCPLVYEKPLTLYDIITADEAFATCTPYSIVPVTQINGHEIGTGGIGEITKQITEAWAQAVKCNFVEQACKWDGLA